MDAKKNAIRSATSSSHPSVKATIEREGSLSSSPRFQLVLKCAHGMPTSLQTCKKPSNLGKKFYGCPMWKSETCGFFIWEEAQVLKEMKHLEIMKASNDEMRMKISKAMEENRRLQTKVDNLWLQKATMVEEQRKMMEEIGELKMMLCIRSKREELMLRVLTFAWFFLAIGLALYVVKM